MHSYTSPNNLRIRLQSPNQNICTHTRHLTNIEPCSPIKPWKMSKGGPWRWHHAERRVGRGETRRGNATAWQRWDEDERWDAATRWHGNARGLGCSTTRGRETTQQPTKRTNQWTNKQTTRVKHEVMTWQEVKMWRKGRVWRRRILCQAIPLPWNIVVVVVCCVVFGRMTVMEMRWAKKVSNSDCLISSDVYGYLYFDLVRYMKCTFSLCLAFGRFLYGLFLYSKWLSFESQFFQVKYVQEKMQ